MTDSFISKWRRISLNRVSMLSCTILDIKSNLFLTELIFMSPIRTLFTLFFQKQPSRGVLRKRCSENMQQIYRRTPVPKYDLLCNFIEIALRHGCSPVNFLHIFRTPFPKKTSERLLLFIRILFKISSGPS